MQWNETVKEYIEALVPVEVNPAFLQRLISLIDFTSLNATDTAEHIAACCEKAKTPCGDVAAVCVYPAFAGLVASLLAGSPIKTVTVANFPDGEAPLDNVLIEINQALAAGVQEIDVVFPYQRYLAGERQYTHTFVAACRAACGESVTLKVILETGVLTDLAIIADASYDVLTAGADFIKTSTGKVTNGASFAAAATMLLVIRHLMPQLKRRLGIKISGGIKDLQQAGQYIELADNILGKENVTPDTFRIGSSKLVEEVLQYP